MIVRIEFPDFKIKVVKGDVFSEGDIVKVADRKPVECDCDGCLVVEGAIDDKLNGLSQIHRRERPTILADRAAIAAACLTEIDIGCSK